MTATKPALSAKIRIAFGALAPPIEDQLKKQKLSADGNKLQVWETARRGILTCYINGYIASSDKDLVFKRLLRDIIRNVSLLQERADLEADL